MFTSCERRSDALFLNHLKLHVDIVPSGIGVWTHLMRFLYEGICLDGGQSGQRDREGDYKAEATL